MKRADFKTECIIYCYLLEDGCPAPAENNKIIVKDKNLLSKIENFVKEKHKKAFGFQSIWGKKKFDYLQCFIGKEDFVVFAKDIEKLKPLIKYADYENFIDYEFSFREIKQIERKVLNYKIDDFYDVLIDFFKDKECVSGINIAIKEDKTKVIDFVSKLKAGFKYNMGEALYLCYDFKPNKKLLNFIFGLDEVMAETTNDYHKNKVLTSNFISISIPVLVNYEK